MKSAIEKVKIGRPATVLKSGKTVTEARKEAAANRSAAKKALSVASKIEKIGEKTRTKAQKATTKTGVRLDALKARTKWGSKEEQKLAIKSATDMFKLAKANEKLANTAYSGALKEADKAAKALIKADEAVAKVEAQVEAKKK
jgi:hypothetical protein